MKFKKKAPLVLFKLDLKFNAPLSLNFDNLAKLEKSIKESYPHSTELFIPKYEGGMKFVFGASQTGPIQFISNQTRNNISLFSDGVIFVFQEYSEWKDVKKHILKILWDLKNILKCKEIIEIRMEIIDEFQFNPENFSLKQYFTLNFIIPDDWKIDFQDFHIGIKHITEPNKKFITRLRGIGQKKNSLIVRLENMFIEKVHLKILNNDDFEAEIDEIHRIIEGKFTQIFKPELVEHTEGEI